MSRGFSHRYRLCTSNKPSNKIQSRVVVAVGGVGVAVGVDVNKPPKKINVTCGNGMQINCNENQLGCNDTSNYGPCSPEALTCHKPFPTGPVEINIDNKVSQGFAARVENDLYVRFPNYCGPGKPNDSDAPPMITQRQFQRQANLGLSSDSLPFEYPAPNPRTPPKPRTPINRRIREVENRALRVLRQRAIMNRSRNNMN